MKPLHFLMLFFICLCNNPLLFGQESGASFQPVGKVIVQVFGYSKFDISKDAKQPLSFGCGRAFLGYNYLYSKSLSATVIIDAAGRPTTVGNIVVIDSTGEKQTVTNTSSQGSYYTAYLKFANIQWKPSEMFTLQVGGILENHYITQERFWGYRYVYETFQDRYYGSPSTDFGAIGYVKLNNTLGFDVAVTNGEGIRVQQDNYGKAKIAAGIDYQPKKGLISRIYYANTSSSDPGHNATQHLYSGFIGYQLDKCFRTAFDFNYRHNDLNFSGHNFWGYSFYETYLLNPKFELFARYDNVVSNTISGPNPNWNIAKEGKAYIAGIHFQPVKAVKFSINYQGWKPKATSLKMTNFIMLNTEFKI